jgi:ADP-ribose pyrophosphatase
LAAKARKPTKVEQQGSEILAEGHLRLERLTLRTDMFAGGTSKIVREVLRSGPAVAVLLYDPVANKLILIEQFRVGAWVSQQTINPLASPWLLECVAGKIDEGETPEEATRREAMEESGCVVERLEFAGAYLSSPGISDELVSIYVGQVDSTHVGGVHGEESEGEDIRTVILSVDEALAAADTGAVVNMVTQVALLWFARHQDALRNRWRTPDQN